MEKNKRDAAKPAIPDNAVKVMEDGQWAVFWSNPEGSFYFMSLDRPSSVLRIFRDELLKLAQKPETRDSARNNAAAMVPAVKEDIVPASARDNRQFRRFTRRCEAEFTCGGSSKRGIAGDFSINGLFIKTSSPFAPDEVIDIMVHLPDNSVSSLQGKVIRAMKSPLGNLGVTLAKAYKNGMGIEIMKKDANYLHFIRSLVKERRA